MATITLYKDKINGVARKSIFKNIYLFYEKM